MFKKVLSDISHVLLLGNVLFAAGIRLKCVLTQAKFAQAAHKESDRPVPFVPQHLPHSHFQRLGTATRTVKD